VEWPGLCLPAWAAALEKGDSDMFDHVSVGITDYAKARDFYDKVLAALGYRRVMEFEGHACAYGPDEQTLAFWIGLQESDAKVAGTGVHICFSAPNRKAVDAFHAEGLKAGGKDEGAPGLRPDYHPNYYAAFLFDRDGNKIEAVCHSPQ
jgi:catechol 2,3-dioxygenase-like lactoylglutathione lyase family enzyme